MRHECVPRVRELVHALIDLVNNPHKVRHEGEMILTRVTKGSWFPSRVEVFAAQRPSWN